MTERHEDRDQQTVVTATEEEQVEETNADAETGDQQQVEEANNESKTSADQQTDDDAQDAVNEQAAEAEESDTADAEQSDDSEDGMQQYDETFVELNPGTIVTGKVVQISEEEVMVDVGYKSEGRIPQHELGLKPGENAESVLQVGDDIEVFILKVEDAEGNVLLSKRRADNRLVWEKLEKLKESGEILEATVTERVKGGLLVDVGIRGFVPASHVDRNYVENLDVHVGKTLRLRVIELDRQRNNVVLSRKEVLEEEYEAAKEKAFKNLKEGSIISGVVRRLTDFGAFVDVGGGVEGLLHVSEMAWSRVNHPKDVLAEGDEIDVMVLEVDGEKERISLSLKETLPDPWDTIDERFDVGQITKATITRVVDFGAFAKLEDGVEGLIHISQLADRHVGTPSEVVNPGDVVDVKVISLDKRARRIGLSIKETIERPQRKKEERPAEQTFSDPNRDDNVTLGDVFEDLQAYFERQDGDDS